jgi:hypothetical protein
LTDSSDSLDLTKFSIDYWSVRLFVTSQNFGIDFCLLFIQNVQ